MLLLVTDTSGKHGSVALARATDPARDEIELIEEVPLAGGTFSAQLVPQIAALLAKHGFTKSDIDAFVVVSGPGSFTGLRVGLAAIKALAEILQKPIVPVSLLAVVALASGSHERIVAALDAGRGEIYVGEYDLASDGVRVRQEQLLTKDEFALAARSRVVATPDEALAGDLRALGISVSLVPPVHAEMVARLGWHTLQAGLKVAPEQLEANYIRRSDAEIFAKPASGS